MTAKKYEKGTRIAYFDCHQKKVVEDEIWLVRQGYYHMPSDDYLHDENIIGSIVDGKRVPNPLFTQDRHDTIDLAQQELSAAAEWCDETQPVLTSNAVNTALAAKTDKDIQIQDLAMIVRKLIKHVPDSVSFKSKATDYLVRKGLNGNIFRSSQENDDALK
jgi:hypothetical protein